MSKAMRLEKFRGARDRARYIRMQVKHAEANGKNLYRMSVEEEDHPARVVGAKSSAGMVFIKTLSYPVWREDKKEYGLYEM